MLNISKLKTIHKKGKVTLLSIIALSSLSISPILNAGSISFGGGSDAKAKTILNLSSPERIPDRYIVIYKTNSILNTSETQNKSLTEINTEVTTDLAVTSGSGLYMRYDSQGLYGSVLHNSSESAIQDLYNDSRVEKIYADTINYPSTTQSNPTWGLDRVDQTNLPLNAKYSYGNDGTGINVFVIDSGIKSSHTEFSGRNIPEIDFSVLVDVIIPPCTQVICEPEPVGPRSDDTMGHGTHVAATIGGETYGVAKNVNLHSVKIFLNGGAPDSVIIEALVWLNSEIDSNPALLPAVVNMSYAGYSNNSILQSLYQDLTDKGVILVAAAGNKNSTNCGYPAKYSNVISIGATTISDTRWSHSNKGTCIDLFAPGENIISASLLVGGSTLKSGTSMASPHVAGAIALYLENNASASPTTVKTVLLSTSSNVSIGNAGSGSPNKILNISSLSPITTTTEDDYDNVTIRGYTDDDEGDAVPLSKNAPQIHNFHDSGDQDWTMVWIPQDAVYEIKTDTIGSNSATNFEVYKVTDIVVNPSYPNANRFIIHDMQLVATGTNNSPKIINADGGFLYVMKVTSSNNSIGGDTNYRVSLNTVSIVNDQYDNISIRSYTDDIDGDAEPIFLNTPQIHNFHDTGDQDWTMVWVPNSATYNLQVNMLGHVSDTKVSVYKVTDVIVNPNYPGTNRFIINQKVLVASDVSSGNKNLTINADGGFLYVMKVESRFNTSGYGTEYEIKLY